MLYYNNKKIHLKILEEGICVFKFLPLSMETMLVKRNCVCIYVCVVYIEAQLKVKRWEWLEAREPCYYLFKPTYNFTFTGM